MIRKEQKQEIVAKYGKDANDTGSTRFRSHFLQQESTISTDISRLIQRIITQTVVFLRWLVREETFLHTSRARISRHTESSSRALDLESNFYSSLNTITIMGIMCTRMIPFYLPGHIFMVSNSVNRGVWILYFLYSYDKI